MIGSLYNKNLNSLVFRQAQEFFQQQWCSDVTIFSPKLEIYFLNAAEVAIECL